MKFSIDYDIKPLANPLTMSDSVLAIGSCFAENMAQQMLENKLDVVLNPNGIVFNPHSLFTHLQNYVRNKNLTEHDLVFDDGLWHSMQHHGSFSSANKQLVIDTIQSQTQLAHQQLKKANYILITLGSAWAYKHLPSQQIVSNNHKLPAHLFTKELLSVEYLWELFKNTWQMLSAFNPNIKLIVSVSPVRYIRDGLHENNISKSVLHLLLHQLTNTYADNVFYFPAYELVIDQLRDYRFYKADMVHPNEQAIDFVWEKFKQTCFDKHSINYLNDFQKYHSLINHKPLHTDSASYAKYVLHCKHLREQINTQYKVNIE
jgi:hypothetical protein